LFLVFTSISPILSHSIVSNSSSSQLHSYNNFNQTFRPNVSLHKLRRIRAHLKKINKPPIKTIKAYYFPFFFYRSDKTESLFCIVLEIMTMMTHFSSCDSVI
jgi:hypothetical protein